MDDEMIAFAIQIVEDNPNPLIKTKFHQENRLWELS